MNHWKSSKVMWTALVGMLVAVLIPLLGYGATSAPKEKLTIVGYVTGTSMDMRAKALGSVFTKFGGYNITVNTTSGMAGLIDFHEGRIDGYLSLQPKKVNDMVMDMYVKDIPASKRRPETVIIPTAIKTLQLLVRKDSPFNSIPEWKAKKTPIKAGVGQRGNKLVMERVFAAYGITFDDMRKWGCAVDDKTSGGKSHDLMRDGKLDTRFAYGGVPEPATEELSRALPVKILPMGETEDIRRKIHDTTDMVSRIIPAKTYSFMDRDIISMGFPELLVVRADLKEQTAYDLAKLVWDHTDYLEAVYEGFKEVLNPKEAIELMESQSIPIHPGAARYYRERGWMK